MCRSDAAKGSEHCCGQRSGLPLSFLMHRLAAKFFHKSLRMFLLAETEHAVPFLFPNDGVAVL